MSCPHNSMGQPACHIVPHPDRPEAESFCTHCRRQFYHHNAGDWFLAAIALVFAAVIVLGLLAASEAPRPASAAIENPKR